MCKEFLHVGSFFVCVFAFGLNPFAALGLATTWLWFAYLLTGFLLAGGSKLWHELISLIRELRPSQSE